MRVEEQLHARARRGGVHGRLTLEAEGRAVAPQVRDHRHLGTDERAAVRQSGVTLIHTLGFSSISTRIKVRMAFVYPTVVSVQCAYAARGPPRSKKNDPQIRSVCCDL